VSGASYASQSDLCVHLGLGTATKVDKLEIHWPNGDIEPITVPAVDKLVIIRQGKGVAAK